MADGWILKIVETKPNITDGCFYNKQTTGTEPVENKPNTVINVIMCNILTDLK